MVNVASGSATVPRWLVIVSSLVIGFHLLAVLVNALAVWSGPWPVMDGPPMATPPQFAVTLHSRTGDYLQAVRLTHNFHFTTNRAALPTVYGEAKLRDDEGKEVAVVRIPDPNANRWVRHRQEVLIRGLGDDQPVAPPGTEIIPAPGQKAPEQELWQAAENEPRNLRLVRVPSHLVPRDRPMLAPSPMAITLANSYARYLCRAHGAASVEFVRRSRDAIPPRILFEDNVPAGALDELVSNFGELKP